MAPPSPGTTGRPGNRPARAVARALADRVDRLRFAPPVAAVYNPLQYARRSHERYLDLAMRPGVPALLLGMNPGPWGMAQTGVPFGEIALVRDWMGIDEPVEKPPQEHPKRPVAGFACTRSEVSGRRLWGWAQTRFGTPEAFFRHFTVWNYCPLAFLEETGRNRTPDKLPANEREPLYAACDDALRALVDWLQPQAVIGVGKFAETRARHALGEDGPRIGTVLHPSPASPVANRGWEPQAEKQLQALGLLD